MHEALFETEANHGKRIDGRLPLGDIVVPLSWVTAARGQHGDVVSSFCQRGSHGACAKANFAHVVQGISFEHKCYFGVRDDIHGMVGSCLGIAVRVNAVGTKGQFSPTTEQEGERGRGEMAEAKELGNG